MTADQFMVILTFNIVLFFGIGFGVGYYYQVFKEKNHEGKQTRINLF